MQTCMSQHSCTYAFKSVDESKTAQSVTYILRISLFKRFLYFFRNGSFHFTNQSDSHVFQLQAFAKDNTSENCAILAANRYI